MVDTDSLGVFSSKIPSLERKLYRTGDKRFDHVANSQIEPPQDRNLPHSKLGIMPRKNTGLREGGPEAIRIVHAAYHSV